MRVSLLGARAPVRIAAHTRRLYGAAAPIQFFCLAFFFAGPYKAHRTSWVLLDFLGANGPVLNSTSYFFLFRNNKFVEEEKGREMVKVNIFKKPYILCSILLSNLMQLYNK